MFVVGLWSFAKFSGVFVTAFDQFGLQTELIQAVTERGYTTPTPIQTGVIPAMLTGRDIVGQAQTGTGKTAAFSLPILQNLRPDRQKVQALILAPTRELALQVANTLYAYGRHLNVSVLPVYGGQPYGRQISRLRKGVDVVVGTPGRLLDLIRQGSLDLSGVRTVILDEADEMLSMGFIEDIESILQETPVERQTALFSATLPPPIRRLAEKYLHNPESVTIEGKQRTADAIEQRYYLVHEQDKLAALTRLFETETITSALIFARTRASTAELANGLMSRGYPAEVLNGDLTQEAREQVLRRFRQNQITVLVATDVAARGLDIENISHVFNFDLPGDVESFVHRIGRTGRAGKTGVAISFVTPPQQYRLRQIEKFTRQKMTEATLPTPEDIIAQRERALMDKMAVWLRRGRCVREREMVAELVEAGHDPVEVAAVALKIARAEEKQRPIEQVTPVEARPPRSKESRARSYDGRKRTPEPKVVRERDGRKAGARSHEAGMVRLRLNVGKAQGVRPGDVVGTIAFHANIPGSTIGAIHIQSHETLVDVPEHLVGQVLDKSGQYQIRQKPVTVQRVT
jgi:ATP-dependent RNA helicase DeaD